MSFEVVLLSAAQREFKSVVQYLEPRSPKGAAAWLTAFEEAVDRLETDGDKLSFAPENEFMELPIRQIVFVRATQLRTATSLTTISRKE